LRFAKAASGVLVVHDFVDVFPFVVAEPFGGDQFVARRTNAVNKGSKMALLHRFHLFGVSM
jgi:hypothetical protein